MSTCTGFSDVDACGRSDDLIDYLALLASRLAEFRREGFELLELQPGSSVLDIGCGAGEVCVDIAERISPHGRVAGVDLSGAMVEAAKRAAAAAGRDIDLRVASVYQLPFADESFDVVRAERVLQHLDDPETALREMLRVTRVGGQIMLIDPDHGQRVWRSTMRVNEGYSRRHREPSCGASSIRTAESGCVRWFSV